MQIATGKPISILHTIVYLPEHFVFSLTHDCLFELVNSTQLYSMQSLRNVCSHFCPMNALCNWRTQKYGHRITCIRKQVWTVLVLNFCIMVVEYLVFSTLSTTQCNQISLPFRAIQAVGNRLTISNETICHVTVCWTICFENNLFVSKRSHKNGFSESERCKLSRYSSVPVCGPNTKNSYKT